MGSVEEHDAGTGKPAPGRLRIVQDAVNSFDPEGGHEHWASPDLLRAWLVERELLADGDEVSVADLERARIVRELLRAMLAANAGDNLDPAVTRQLDGVAATVRVRIEEDGRARLESARMGVDGALCAIIGIMYEAMVDGTWLRLKACRKHSCKWAFYDRSKNRSGSWCSMSVCGNRVKTRQYRERKRATAG